MHGQPPPRGSEARRGALLTYGRRRTVPRSRAARRPSPRASSLPAGLSALTRLLLHLGYIVKDRIVTCSGREIYSSSVNSELGALQLNSLNFAAVQRKDWGAGMAPHASAPSQSFQVALKMSGKRRKECARLEPLSQSPLSLKISLCFRPLLGNNQEAFCRFSETVKYHRLAQGQLEARAGFPVKKPGLTFQFFH